MAKALGLLLFGDLMPILEGPTYDENAWSNHPLWGRYKEARGITLAVRGAEVTELIYPWQGEIQNEENPYDHVYLGGHTHTISEAEAAVLTAAGYGAYITP